MEATLKDGYFPELDGLSKYSLVLTTRWCAFATYSTFVLSASCEGRGQILSAADWNWS